VLKLERLSSKRVDRQKRVHVLPGKPTQNALVESFRGRLREERLTEGWFQNLFGGRLRRGGKTPRKSILTAVWDIERRRSSVRWWERLGPSALPAPASSAAHPEPESVVRSCAPRPGQV